MYMYVCLCVCMVCVCMYLFLIICKPFTQRQCIVNLFRACVGLAPDDSMLLEHRVPSLILAQAARKASDAAGLKISILHIYIHAIYLRCRFENIDRAYIHTYTYIYTYIHDIYLL